MARKSANFGSQFGDSCNGVGAAVRVCRRPWLRWLPRQVTCRPDFRAHSAQDLGLLGTTRERLFACGLESVVPPPTPQGALGWELYSSLGDHVQPSSSERWVCTDAPRLGRSAPHSSSIMAVWRHARPTALMSTSMRERVRATD